MEDRGNFNPLPPDYEQIAHSTHWVDRNRSTERESDTSSEDASQCPIAQRERERLRIIHLVWYNHTMNNCEWAVRFPRIGSVEKLYHETEGSLARRRD